MYHRHTIQKDQQYNIMYKFYIEMDGDQFGPYSAIQIKELDLLPDIMVRQEGSIYWQRADSYYFNSLAKI